MSATADIQYTPLDADSAPERFQILSAFNLTPHDIQTTPPATAELFMSPEFTNPRGADADSGKTRDYVVVINYPPGVENTVVRMDDVPTWAGSRMFREFVENTAEKQGYTSERVPVEDYLTE